MYGTASEGGNLTCAYGCGVVYKLNSTGTETVLHRFSGSPDGCLVFPGLVRDSGGNLYGTTWSCGSSGGGTVFKVDSAGNETVLYSFSGGTSDGCSPFQGLIRDHAGNLYGTTWHCGSSGYGTIFKVDNAGNETVLHSFTGGSSDGGSPYLGHLLIDTKGNLYGATSGGGASGNGVLYKVSKKRKFTILHSFAGGTSDGCGPFGSVVQDKAGNLYGTTSACGSKGYGTIWKVSTTGKETIVHNFAGSPSDGCGPWAGVTRDSKGNLYGVAGCGANSYGALYKLGPRGRLTLLHSFDGIHGRYPYGEVLRTSKGTLFGTTYVGGTGNSCQPYGSCGTVWSYVP